MNAYVQGSTTWENYSDGDIMYTNGHVTGDPVLAAYPALSGSWSKWNAPM
jgi:hypothetical protein